MKEYELTGTEITYLKPRRTTAAEYALYAIALTVFLGFCYLVSQQF